MGYTLSQRLKDEAYAISSRFRSVETLLAGKLGQDAANGRYIATTGTPDTLLGFAADGVATEQTPAAVKALLAIGTADVAGLDTTLGEAGDLLSTNNLSDLASAATARTNLGLGTSATMAAEWAPNFTAAGDAYIPAVVAMTINQGNAKIGTGTLAFAKSTNAAPSTFSSTTLPATLEAGAWLKVSASAVTGFVATHLTRTA